MATKESKKGLVKVRFLISPTGKYGLGYNAGDEVDLDEAQAAEIVGNGDATYTQPAEAAKADTKAKEAAETEAKTIVDNANAEAMEIVNKAKAEAEDIVNKAKEAAAKNLPVNDAENASDKGAAGAEKR